MESYKAYDEIFSSTCDLLCDLRLRCGYSVNLIQQRMIHAIMDDEFHYSILGLSAKPPTDLDFNVYQSTWKLKNEMKEKFCCNPEIVKILMREAVLNGAV